jgi:hypothetical protein
MLSVVQRLLRTAHSMLCARTDKQRSTSNVAAMTAEDMPAGELANYTGHVDPGTAARRTLPGATILKASVGPMDNNAYLVTCAETGETLLIDAANDADLLIDLIRRYAPRLSLITSIIGRRWRPWPPPPVRRPPPTRSTPSRCRSNPSVCSRAATPCTSAS